MKYSDQSQAVQRLLARMREMGWGEIENLPVRDGDPILDNVVHVAHDIMLNKDYEPIPYKPKERLKPQVQMMLRQFRETRDGIIPSIRFVEGLPTRIVIEVKV